MEISDSQTMRDEEVIINSSVRSRLDDLPPELRNLIANFNALPMRAVLALVPQFRIRSDDVLRAQARLCEWAAENGYLDLLKWAHARGYSLHIRDGRELCALAARGGHLAVLQWLREQKCRWDTGTSYNAAQAGHLELLQWALDRGCPSDRSTTSAAATGGQLAVLQWLRARGCEWDRFTTFEAARAGHLPVLEWALANGCERHPDAAAMAVCCSGDLPTVQWALAQPGLAWWRFNGVVSGLTFAVLRLLKERQPTLPDDILAMATRQLALSGDLRGLQWARENGCLVARHVGSGAAKGGQLAVLQWALECGFAPTWDCDQMPDLACLEWAVAHGKEPGPQTCAAAAARGNLRALQWLRQTARCEWDGETLESALSSGHCEVIEWARQQGCPVNARVIEAAARGGFAEVLKWALESAGDSLARDKRWCGAAANLPVLRLLREYRCPWNENTCVDFALRGELELLKWAHENGCPWDQQTCRAAAWNNLYVLQWAIANGCPVDEPTLKWARDLESAFEISF